MRLNADFSKRAFVIPGEDDWVHSPEAGVDRIMLDRIGDEVARATSIVRYAAGSSFARHEHARGEEFLVIDGVFSDEHGDFPTGTYVRNPPGSGHSPYSENGCEILVKLRQFDATDLEHVVVDTNNDDAWQQLDDSGTAMLQLHRYESELVRMFRMSAGVSYECSAAGVEIFVVRGEVSVDELSLHEKCWLRIPVGEVVDVTAISDAVLWLKQGHLTQD